MSRKNSINLMELFITNRTADEFRFCCLKRNLEYCWPPPNEFSSCDDLMTSIVLRICIWVLGITAVIANVFVIIIRTWYTNRNVNKVYYLAFHQSSC